MSKFGFDLNEYVGEERNYDPLPKGEYDIACTEAELKTTKSGGEMIAAAFEVVTGKHTGRKIWNNYNIHNKSEKAQQIGREQLSAWARACGKPNANNVDELLERKFKAMVDIEAGTDGYADKNRIVGYTMPSTAPAVKPKAEQLSIADMAEDNPDDAPTTAAKAGKKKNPWD
jgi:hypothetical protein